MDQDIATRIKVSLDTTGLDKLKGIIPELDNVVDEFKQSLDNGADNLAGEAAKALKQYEEEYFNYHNHPFETKTARNLFVAEPETSRVWFVDNKAENRGFPYMVTEEHGTNPGRKLAAHPFAAPARKKLESEIKRLVDENITRKL